MSSSPALDTGRVDPGPVPRPVDLDGRRRQPRRPDPHHRHRRRRAAHRLRPGVLDVARVRAGRVHPPVPRRDVDPPLHRVRQPHRQRSARGRRDGRRGAGRPRPSPPLVVPPAGPGPRGGRPAPGGHRRDHGARRPAPRDRRRPPAHLDGPRRVLHLVGRAHARGRRPGRAAGRPDHPGPRPRAHRAHRRGAGARRRRHGRRTSLGRRRGGLPVRRRPVDHVEAARRLRLGVRRRARRRAGPPAPSRRLRPALDHRARAPGRHARAGRHRLRPAVHRPADRPGQPAHARRRAARVRQSPSSSGACARAAACSPCLSGFPCSGVRGLS